MNAEELKCFVKVNGKTELQRGKKLYDGDMVSFEEKTIKIEK